MFPEENEQLSIDNKLNYEELVAEKSLLQKKLKKEVNLKICF